MEVRPSDPWVETHVLYGDGGVTGRQTDDVWVFETAT
jgi:hypothetical protein